MKSAQTLNLSPNLGPSKPILKTFWVKPFLERLSALARKYGLLLIFLFIWELSGRANLVDQTIVPSLSTSLSSVVEMWNHIHLGLHIMASLGRVIIGLIIGLVVAVPLAFILGRLLPNVAAKVDALLRVFGLINPYCLFPVFVIFFGLGETPKIAVLAWVSVWPIYFSAQTACRNVDPQLLKTARSMNCGAWAIFFRVTLPATIPAIFNGVRIGVEMSFFILIAAEMTGATAGLGWIVHNAGASYQTVRIYGAGICVVLLGVLINRFLLVIKRAFLSFSEALSPSWLQNAKADHKPISKTTGYVWLIVFVVLMVFGFYQVFKAENLLLDATLTPDYRIWNK